MEKTAFITKLSEVFEFLLNLQDSITDDTCLQRLLDVLHDKFSDEECPGMDQFIEKACGRLDNLEPSVISFALHLSGQAAWKGSVSHGVMCLYQTVSEKQLWQDSSIGTAYFNSLSEIARTSHGFKWLMQQNSDFIQQALLSLQENTSLFLHASARRLLMRVLKNKYPVSDNVESHNPASLVSIGHRIRQDFNVELKRAAAMPGKRLNVYLQNLMSLLTSCDVLQEHEQDEDEVVLQLLLKLCLNSQMGANTVCEDLLLHHLRGRSQRVSDFVKRELGSVCNNGSENSDVCKFHKLAVKLHQSFPDIDDSAILENIVMIPFHVVTGETQSDTLTSDCIGAFERAMTNKTSCTQLMLNTASWVTEKNGHMKDLVTILCCTHQCDDAPVNGSLAGNIQQNLSNSRLQQCLLGGIYKNIDEALPVNTVMEALDIIIKVTSGVSTHNGVLEKGFECITSLLATLPGESDGLKSCLPLVTSLLEKCLVGTQWEHRDTAVESVTKLVTRIQDKPAAMSVLASTRVLVSAWKCITDSDSYVRASSIRLADKMASYPHVWETFLSQLGQTEEYIIMELKEIICTDSEAFPRRAAVLCLLAIYSHRRLSESSSREISSIMMQAMTDFDWEVKANALGFWQYVCDQKLKVTSVPDYAVSLLPTGTKRKSHEDSTLTATLLELNQNGLFVALMCGLEDYDPHVCEKTYTILNGLKQKINFDDVNETDLKKFKCENGFTESQVHSSSSDESCSEKVKSDTDCMRVVLNAMKETDFEEKLSVSSKSVDVYSKNPIALLEDILSEDKDIEEDKFVDCY